MTVWYKVNPNRLTYGELWRVTRGGVWPFVHAVYRKWFNVRECATIGFTFPDALEFIEFQQLPERPREALGEMISQAEVLGFRLLFCHKRPTLGELKTYSAALLSADAMTLGMAIWVAAGGRNASVGFAAASRCEDRRLVTSNSNHTVDEPPEIETLHFPGRSIDEIVALHALRLERRGLERIQHMTEADASQRIVGYGQRVLAFKLARGAYEPMTQEEVDWLSGRMTTRSAALDGNPYQAPQCLDETRPAYEKDQRPQRTPPAPPKAAPPKDNWWGATGGGFVAGILGGMIFVQNQVHHPVFPTFEQWEANFGLAFSLPLLTGLLGSAVSFAAWSRRRTVSERGSVRKTPDAPGS